MLNDVLSFIGNNWLYISIVAITTLFIFKVLSEDKYDDVVKKIIDVFLNILESNTVEKDDKVCDNEEEVEKKKEDDLDE